MKTMNSQWVLRLVAGILPFYLFTFLPLNLNAQGLKDAMGKYCLIGAAVNQWQSDGQVPEADAVLDKHFNCAVAGYLDLYGLRKPTELDFSSWDSGYFSETLDGGGKNAWTVTFEDGDPTKPPVKFTDGTGHETAVVW